MDDWTTRVAAVWADAATRSDDEVAAAIDALVAERPADDPLAVFELAGARDYAGRETEAEPLYRRALDLGLPEPARSSAIIQLASTVRNLGRPQEALELLRSGFAEAPGHPLGDAATAFAARPRRPRPRARGPRRDAARAHPAPARLPPRTRRVRRGTSTGVASRAC